MSDRSIALFILIPLSIILIAIFLTPFYYNEPNPLTSDSPKSKRTFPKNFKIGTAVSALQTEGAWNEDGKGPSIWDDGENKYRNPDQLPLNITVATNFYKNYKEDIKLLKSLGIQVFRFSISWPRIFTDGTRNSMNEKGIKFYDDLINELIRNGIEPIVTIHHYDVPQPIQDLGGWFNPIIIDYLEDFADILFERYGDRVKYWMTINEPALFCEWGHDMGIYPPMHKTSGIGVYKCGHNMLLAHARIYHLYKKKYFSKQFGKIGIVLNGDYYIPKNMSKVEDVEASEKFRQFTVGWFAHPIYSKSGDYPSVMRKTVDEKSKNENLKRSRLPVFTKDEIEYVKGSADFLGFNYYTSKYVEMNPKVKAANESSSINSDMGILESDDPNWMKGHSFWLHSVPSGLRDYLRWIKNQYNSPVVIITENGWSNGGDILDNDRITYIREHLNVLLDAIYEDNCNVQMYMYWSLMDSYEFLDGFNAKFGLFHVNFSSNSLERTPKNSAKYFSQIIKKRQIPDFHFKLKNDKSKEFPEEFVFGVKLSNDQNEETNLYKLFLKDLNSVIKLGVNFYQFSINWSNILSNDSTSPINEKVLNYYDQIINELLLNKIEPMITMYDSNLPENLRNIGGWTNSNVIDHFIEYAKLLFDRFGDRVKTWITFNNPSQYCLNEYNMIKISGSKNSKTDSYTCGHHILLAHGKVYQLYRQKYFFVIDSVGIGNGFIKFLPKDPENSVDIEASERANELYNDWIIHPIYTGNYSQKLRKIIDGNGFIVGSKESSLPYLSDEEAALIKGSSDFLGVNFLGNKYVKSGKNSMFIFENNLNAAIIDVQKSNRTALMRDFLRDIKIKYNTRIMIIDNQLSEQGLTGHLECFKEYLESILDVIWKDGCYVTGYSLQTSQISVGENDENSTFNQISTKYRDIIAEKSVK